MRLFAKIFLCTTLVLSAALLLSGYLLIKASYESAIEREKEHALNTYQYDKFSVQSALLSSTDQLEYFFKEITGTLNGKVAFFEQDGTLIYTNLPNKDDLQVPKNSADGFVTNSFFKAMDKTYITVCGKVTQGDFTFFMLVASDVSEVILGRRQMIYDFGNVYFVTLGVSTIVVFLLTVLLTRPIKRLTKAANRMAGGRYDERIQPSGKDEIAMLSKSFNHMAATVEDRIKNLEDNARQKEDFVANFAHELKTPLTSVIGYADMLYQKPMPFESVKDAAGYIMQEGLRLETLSIKLMDLIVLGRKDFVLVELPTVDVLQNVATSVQTLILSKGVILHTSFESTYILAEFDLLKTLLLNLLDNAVKSDAKDIWLEGKLNDDKYFICVRDNGRGMIEEELSCITEAFYMIDKSRTSTQHSAGLGLALSQRIAQLHGDSLHFTSALGVGTTVSFSLAIKGGGTD